MAKFAFRSDFVDMGKKSRVPAPSSSNEDYDRFKNLPASSNVEDRRGEAGTHGLLQSWTGLSPGDWGKALKHPMTPFWDLFPGAKSGDNQGSSLAKDAGIDDIGKK